jgi:hypothetical protein
MAPPPKSDPFLADSQREVDAGAVFVLESKGKQKKNACKNTWRDVFFSCLEIEPDPTTSIILLCRGVVACRVSFDDGNSGAYNTDVTVCV